jgi:hypothetical protein
MSKILMLLATCLMAAAPAVAADGWTMRPEAPGCFADRAQGGGATVEIGVWPSRVIIGFSRPDLQVVKRAVPATLRIDGAPAVVTDALGFGHGYAVTVRPVFAEALRKATQLEFVADTQSFRLDITNAAAAMDEAGRCAQLKSLPGIAEPKLEWLEDAPGWQVVRHVWITDQCAARRPGSEADTLIFHTSERGVLAVAIWRADWMKPDGPFMATVSIDNGPPRQVMAMGGFELAVWKVPYDDRAVVRDAHTMTWKLPWGTYTTDITGLSDAAENLHSYWC